MNFAKQAAVLVGGKGSRLGALASTAPKPLLKIDSQVSFLDEVIFSIARHGFTEILLLAGKFHEQVTARYHKKNLWGASIRVVVESEAAGTAGALLVAQNFLEPTFLLANGDTLFEFNIRRLTEMLDGRRDAVGALALRRVEDVARFGQVDLEDQRIIAFREKDSLSVNLSGLINSGIGFFRSEVLSYIDKIPFSMEANVYPRLSGEGRLLGREFDGFFIDIGLPETLAQARQLLPQRRRRPALFLDRDGVLNEDQGYTYKVENLQWIAGAKEMIARANDLGILVFVVTNQAGIGHGHYGVDAVECFHRRMSVELAAFGAHIDAFYFCPYHPDARVLRYRHPNHPDRKPNSGMIEKALSEWPVNRMRSVLIGDRESDLVAAEKAGIPGLFFSGHRLEVIAEKAFSIISGN